MARASGCCLCRNGHVIHAVKENGATGRPAASGAGPVFGVVVEVFAVAAGHGPTLFAGLSKHLDLRLVSRLEFAIP
jgi:hypothetical protein